MRLGVNIDHVATLREVRRAREPEPVLAALICEASGADSVVAHLREDRRHIKDRDVFLLKKAVRTRFNLEMSLDSEIVDIACRVRPDQATRVPGRREELTTEGGLDVVSRLRRVRQVVSRLSRRGIETSLFIDPERKQVEAAKKTGARMIELHTGRFAEARDRKEEDRYFREVEGAARFAGGLGLSVNAGHGLDYCNAARVAGVKEIEELNIGYSIICRAVLVGLAQAVKEMKKLIH
jgi:pyridoxine 5-phosphate synthase